MDDREKTLITLAGSFLVVSLFFLGTTITGFASMPLEYRDLCRQDNDCLAGKMCCITYQKEGIGLCQKACQSVQFLCSQDTDCENENVCCKSEGSLGICNTAEKCLDAPVLNKELYEKIKKVEPMLESPAPLTADEYRTKYRIVFLVETAIIAALSVVLWHLLKERRKKRKAAKK